MATPQIQSIVCAFQKLMQQKGFSLRTQWDELTIMPTQILSKATFLQRISSYGLVLTDDEISTFWDYFNLKPNSVDFNDFTRIMRETFPTNTQNDFPVSFHINDYNRSVTPSVNQRPSYNQTSFQASPQRNRSINASATRSGQRNQQDVIRRTKNYDSDDEGEYSYYTCKTIKERELPPLLPSEIRNFDSLSNTSIQRQKYDGPATSRKAFKPKISLKRVIATISDAAYAADPCSWTCFLRWRNPTKDTIDAQDLINGMRKDHKIDLSVTEAQMVIDKYGPLTQNTFKLMLTDGARYSRQGIFDDE